MLLLGAITMNGHVEDFLISRARKSNERWFGRAGRANRPLIREQAFGEALDPDKLERLGRYEVHLDRKLERMLAKDVLTCSYSAVHFITVNRGLG